MDNLNVEAFLQALREIDGGLFLAEVADKHAEAVRVCRERNKKSGVAISLGLKPNKYGQAEVVARVEIALPKSDTFGAIFYMTEDGRLVRRDPRQPELPGIEERDEDDEERSGEARAARTRGRSERMRKEMAEVVQKIVPMSPQASA